MKERKPDLSRLRSNAIRLLLLPPLFFGATIFVANFIENTQNPLSSIRQQNEFNIGEWEAHNLPGKIKSEIFNRKNLSGEEKIDLVQKYFSKSPRDQSLEKDVEQILEEQINKAYEEEGLPSFPPVLIKIEKRSKSVVGSPVEEVKNVMEFPLKSGLTPIQIDELIDKLESLPPDGKTSKFGLSVAAVPNGGWAFTIPISIARDDNFITSLKISAHEPSHQKSFWPSSLLYILNNRGIIKNPDIETINETLADIVGEEITQKVLNEFESKGIKEKVVFEAPKTVFDINKELRDTRIEVDKLLQAGEIEKAKEYMKGKEGQLRAKGFSDIVVKQATLARVDKYSVQTSSVNPIGGLMRKLRAKSKSLKDFFNKASQITSLEGLKKAVEN